MTRTEGSYPFSFCRKAYQTAAQKRNVLLLMGTDNRQLSVGFLLYKRDDLSARVLIQTGKRFIHKDGIKGYCQRPADGNAAFHAAA